MNIRHLTTIGILFAGLAACEPRPADQPEGPAGRPVIQDEGGERRDMPAEPDNTARNKQDRAEGAKTPFDQAENGSDIATTAAIRREILKTDNLSTNADNVKIITSNGQVTLRGVVASEAERDTVTAIATRIAGSPEQVDVQLDIDPDGAKAELKEAEKEAEKAEDKAEDRMDDADREGALDDNR